MKTRVRVAVLAALAGWARLLSGAEAVPPSPAEPQVVLLSPSDGEQVLLRRWISCSARPGAFKKEPEVSKSGVSRSRLQFGGGSSNSFACLWDRPKRLLHLDLNRNEDLTDDPGGVFTAVVRGGQQIFFGVRVPLSGSTGTRSSLFNLTLTTYGGDYLGRVEVGLRSRWQGKASWRDQEWEVSLVEDPLDSSRSASRSLLLLRPWAERAMAFGLADDSPDTIRLPKKLFWQSQAWSVNRQFTGEGAAAQCRLEFKPETPRLGELKIGGALLHRVILEDESGYTAFLDAFDQPLRIPAGSYKVGSWLKKDRGEAVCSEERQIVVKEGAPAILRTGGPLTNSVSVERHGKNLVMSYRLVGAGGAAYRLRNEDRAEPPEFAVYRGDKKVVSGKFAYG